MSIYKQHITGKVTLRDEIELLDDRVVIRRKRALGVVRDAEEVHYSRIASVRVTNGPITGDLHIETQGGSLKDLSITKLSRRDAAQAAEEIRRRIGGDAGVVPEAVSGDATGPVRRHAKDLVDRLLDKSDAPPESIPAGWYPDQNGTIRWWDGNQWTHHTQ